jgi:hypothetical protein
VFVFLVDVSKLATTTIAKMVAEAWKSISTEQKGVWEEKATKDRERFEREKKSYTGPWKVIAGKPPNAPKRPMSAYLDYSNSRRAQLRRQYPNATNGQISKMLADVWKEAPVEMKREYIEREAMLREQYKIELAAWKVANEGKPLVPEESGDVGLKDEAEAMDLESGEAARYDPDDDDRKPSAIVDRSANQQVVQQTEESRRMISSGHTSSTAAIGVASSSYDMRFSDVARMVSTKQEDSAYVRSRFAGPRTSSNKDDAASSQQLNYMTLFGGGGASYLSHAAATAASDNNDQVQEALEPLISTDVGGFLAAAAALDSALQDPSTRENDFCDRVKGVVAELPNEINTTGTDPQMLLLKSSSSSNEETKSNGG